MKQLINHGGRSLLYQYNGSLLHALQAIYPEHVWNVWKFTIPHNTSIVTKSRFSKDQYLLFQHIQEVSIFPRFRIEFNYNYADYTKRGRSIEFDVSIIYCKTTNSSQIFVPELALAFEYNGEYHYTSIPVYLAMSNSLLRACYNDLENVHHRDKQKQLICLNGGITLITIPFWWNKTLQSVAHTVHVARPDIPMPSALLNGDPIPNEMPKQRPSKVPYHPKQARTVELYSVNQFTLLSLDEKPIYDNEDSGLYFTDEEDEAEYEEELCNTQVENKELVTDSNQQTVLLGYVGEKLSLENDTDKFATKIGGKPIWLAVPPSIDLICKICSAKLHLIVQAFAPLEPHFDRSLYIFGCASAACSNQSESWLALRMQSPAQIDTPTGSNTQSASIPQQLIPDDTWVEDTSWSSVPQNVDLDQLLTLRDLSLTQQQHTSKREKKKDTLVSARNQADTVLFHPYNVESDYEPPASVTLTHQEEKMMKRYEAEEQDSRGEQWGKEHYENTETDKMFTKFHKRLQRSPEQCIRYSFGGTPLWISSFLPAMIPNCQYCNLPRVFELQLLPTLLTLGLKANQKRSPKDRIEFGTVTIFSCSKSCINNNDTFTQEHVFVQPAV